MRKQLLELVAPGIFVAAALALAISVSAQTTPPSVASSAPMTSRPMDKAPEAKSDVDLKAECQAMMARKQEMKEKMKAQDAALDKLVAEMNAAKGSKEMDAMEKPMAAVINELVAQRKAHHAMMMEMQPEMMAHMMRHMEIHGAKGAMDCPMMKAGMDHGAKPKI